MERYQAPPIGKRIKLNFSKLPTMFDFMSNVVQITGFEEMALERGKKMLDPEFFV